MKKFLLIILAAGALVACDDSKADDRKYVDPNDVTVHEQPAKFEPWVIKDSSDIQWQESGLGIYVVEEGAGPKPPVGQNVSVHYHGMLTNGTVFDSSFERGQPFNFPLGAGRVIAGWDEGIAKLNQGSKAVLIIPSELGYGPRSQGKIPANATLIFDVEVLGNF